MCIISALPSGKEKNNEKTRKFITSGFNCNRDGSGYMYKRRNSNIVTINKGFFNIEELLQAIEDEKLEVEDELVVHHRISTAGKVSKENCHPFVLSKTHTETAATKISVSKPCLVHNGHFSKLSYYQNLDRDFSDTYAFSRYILSNPKLREIMETDEDLFDTLTEHIIGSSKVCIIYPEKNRPMYLLGDFIEDDGYYHSNTGYCRQTYDRGGSSNWNSGSYGYGEFMDYDDENIENWQLEIREDRKRREHLLEQEKIKDKAKVVAQDLINSINSDTTNGKISVLLKLNGDILKLSNKNCTHFNFVSKENYTKSLLNHKWDFATIDNYNAIQAYQSLLYKDPTGERTYELREPVATEKLNKEYYFLPKMAYAETYRQYLILLKGDESPGKQTLKKLSKLLEKNIMLTNDKSIYYAKYVAMFLKSSLLAYKDYLEDLFEKQTKFEEAKVININTVNDAIDAGQSIDIINALKDSADIEKSNKEFLKSLDIIDAEVANSIKDNEKLEEDFITNGKNSLQTILDHLDLVH